MSNEFPLAVVITLFDSAGVLDPLSQTTGKFENDGSVSLAIIASDPSYGSVPLFNWVRTLRAYSPSAVRVHIDIALPDGSQAV